MQLCTDRLLCCCCSRNRYDGHQVWRAIQIPVGLASLERRRRSDRLGRARTRLCPPTHHYRLPLLCASRVATTVSWTESLAREQATSHQTSETGPSTLKAQPTRNTTLQLSKPCAGCFVCEMCPSVKETHLLACSLTSWPLLLTAFFNRSSDFFNCTPFEETNSN